MKRFIMGFLIIIFLGTLSYYVFQQILLLYSLNDKKNIPLKRDYIEQMMQKQEIINSAKSSEEKLFIDYYHKVEPEMKAKLREMCYRQFIHVIQNKPACTLDSLDITSLKDLDTVYELMIQNLVKTQDQVIQIEELRLTTLSSPSPDKQGWMRYVSQDGMFHIDYPKNISIGRETPELISFEKGDRDSNIYIQKGYVYGWDKELYPKLKEMKIGETVVNAGCDKPSFDSFCDFTRFPNEDVNSKQMKVYTSVRSAGYPNKIKLFLYIHEKDAGYMIGLETNEKSTNKGNITLSEFKEILSSKNSRSLTRSQV